MAKKKASNVKKQEPVNDEKQPDPLAHLPKETQEKLKKIKEKLDTFQKRIVEKFDKYIMGVALMPPPKQPAQMPGVQPNMPPGMKVPQMPQQPTLNPAQMQAVHQPKKQDKKQDDKKKKDEISVLVLIDDSDSKKMSKFELKDKLLQIMDKIALEIDPNIIPNIILISELWQNCYDAKYEVLQLISMSAPIYDTGMLSAIKIAEIHRSMVLKKFEKYIVSYVLAGSLVQGRATKTSDIDVWIVIDDTDVKKMTRVELKDKLRAIIIGMGLEAGEITGIKNKLNIQVYILTDFWDSLKEANPIIFTLLRDGVPFFDRGIFMPWKQLLRMGKIKPSAEAIDIFMSSGQQMIRTVQAKIRNIGMEDIYYAILTPSQAALMMHGIAPPAPRETADLLEDIFVKKQKLLEQKYVDTLRKVIQTRKDLEHGTLKDITGKEIDDMLKDADKYLKRINRLFSQIEKEKEEEDMVHIYDSIITIIRDVLKLEGVEKVADVEIVKVFEDELISTGKVPAKYLRTLNDIIQGKQDYDDKKLTKQEVESVKKSSREFIKFLVEHIQRKRGRELEKAKIRVKHGEKYGEVILLENHAYIIHDIDAHERRITRAELSKDGKIGKMTECKLEDYEKDIAEAKIPPKVFIRHDTFDDLKEIFGKDVEILVG